jgi:hypothetical protein
MRLFLHIGASFKSLLLSFPRKPESSIFCRFWAPAFAGVTLFIHFEIASSALKFSEGGVLRFVAIYIFELGFPAYEWASFDSWKNPGFHHR